MTAKVSHIHKHLSNKSITISYKGINIKIKHRPVTNDYIWLFDHIETTRHSGKAITHANAMKNAKRRVDLATKHTYKDES